MILILVPPRTLISEADVVQLAALLQLDLLHGYVLSHRGEVRVDQRIWVSLSTLAGVSTVIESCGLQHLPNRRITPVVGNHLRPDLDLEVIVASSERSWNSEVFVPV